MKYSSSVIERPEDKKKILMVAFMKILLKLCIEDNIKQ